MQSHHSYISIDPSVHIGSRYIHWFSIGNVVGGGEGNTPGMSRLIALKGTCNFLEDWLWLKVGYHYVAAVVVIVADGELL